METRAAYVVVGAFVLGLVAALIAGALWFGHVAINTQFSFYDIYFTGSVTGLQKDSVVRYNGIAVGRVADIQLDPQDPQRVRVTVQVNATSVIKSDVVASQELQGITGGAYIEISGGSREAQPIERKEGERYPVIASRSSGLQQVAASAPEVLARIITLSDRLAALLDDHNRQAVTQTLENVNEVTAAAASHVRDIDSLLSDAAATARDIRAAVDNANRTLDGLRQLTAPGGGVPQAVKSIEETARALGSVAKGLDGLIQDARAPVRDFGRVGLPGFEQLMADARALVNQLTRVAELIERDPSRFLFGDRRPGYQPR